MKTHLLKTEQGIALEIDGVVSDCKLEFSEEVSKGIGELWGIWDVVDLAVERTLEHNYESIEQDSASILGFKDGFNKYQLLNKEKLFTMEDMEKAIDLYRELGLNVDKTLIENVINLKNDIISSLRPDRVECTVEMEEINTPFGSGLQPKITDGKIKVLTLIK